MTAPGRFVEFVVASRELSGAQLVELFGPADEPVQWRGDYRVTRWGTRYLNEASTWVLKSSLPPEVLLDDHLRELYARTVAVVTPVVDAGTLADIRSILRIVQYMSESDPPSLGVGIGHDWIALLSSLRGEIEIDQYIAEG